MVSAAAAAKLRLLAAQLRLTLHVMLTAFTSSRILSQFTRLENGLFRADLISSSTSCRPSYAQYGRTPLIWLQHCPELASRCCDRHAMCPGLPVSLAVTQGVSAGSIGWSCNKARWPAQIGCEVLMRCRGTRYTALRLSSKVATPHRTTLRTSGHCVVLDIRPCASPIHQDGEGYTEGSSTIRLPSVA